MTEDVLCLKAGATVAEAELLMRECELHHLPVLDGERVVGVLSDRDFARFSAFPEVKVASLMSRMTISCHPDDSIQDAARRMADERIHCLPVIADGRLVGVVTSMDLVEWVSVHDEA